MSKKLKILIATTNRGKAEEFAALLPFDVELVTLADLGLDPPEEPGETFVENATMKAMTGSRSSGLITIADDSGICVNALGGAPGILSARFSGETATDASNRLKLLNELKDVPMDSRAAHFEAAIVVAYDNSIVSIGIGRTCGSIGEYERGDHGFGYDSLFVLPDGRTMAELSPMDKNRMSHRANATAQIIPALGRLIEAMKPR